LQALAQRVGVFEIKSEDGFQFGGVGRFQVGENRFVRGARGVGFGRILGGGR
jgi:hypothetical protein